MKVMIWLRNQKLNDALNEHEIIGELKQSTYIDQNGILHEGSTIEELSEDYDVGIYIPALYFTGVR